MSDHMEHCAGCHWMYYPLNANDPGLCGTCLRERGLLTRTPETDELDRRVRAQQREQRAVA